MGRSPLTEMHKLRVKQTRIIDVPNLGQRIREARKASGLSPTAVAFHAGMSSPRLFQIESAREDEVISEEVLRRLEAAIGCDFGISFDQAIPVPLNEPPTARAGKAERSLRFDVTEAEWLREVALWEQGKSAGAIARDLSVAASSVKARIKREGRQRHE